MTEGNPITIVGDLSKPATVLIEKISEAVGGYFKPYQIKRVAKAEAEAEIISAQAQIEITEIQRRGATRFFVEEAKKQENIEGIIQKAIPNLEDSSEPQNMEDDWITNFFDKCRIVSDEEMQSLWAKVLAGEANAPGTYSKRTVNFLGSLDKTDANLFTNLCGFGWLIGDVVPLIYDKNASLYNDQGIDFSALSHLDDIGLISFGNLDGFRKIYHQSYAVVYYDGVPLIVDFRNTEDKQLDAGMVLLTRTGQQLAPICGSRPVDGFYDYVVDKWVKEGLILASPYPRQEKK